MSFAHTHTHESTSDFINFNYLTRALSLSAVVSGAFFVCRSLTVVVDRPRRRPCVCNMFAHPSCARSNLPCPFRFVVRSVGRSVHHRLQSRRARFKLFASWRMSRAAVRRTSGGIGTMTVSPRIESKMALLALVWRETRQV